jgi:hypothetical protein
MPADECGGRRFADFTVEKVMDKDRVEDRRSKSRAP